LGDERDLVLEKMGTDVGGFGGSRLRAKIFGLRCGIAFGSVAAFPSVLLHFFLRFGCFIGLGSDAAFVKVRTDHWRIGIRGRKED